MRSLDDELLDLLIQALDTAEERYPYVTRERLRSVARAEPCWHPITSRLTQLLRAGQEALLVLSDDRSRVTRQGALRPTRLYRLNRRSPRVLAALS